MPAGKQIKNPRIKVENIIPLGSLNLSEKTKILTINKLGKSVRRIVIIGKLNNKHYLFLTKFILNLAIFEIDLFFKLYQIVSAILASFLYSLQLSNIVIDFLKINCNLL